MACPPNYPQVGIILPVTSVTRPVGNDRYSGQRIFEADTGRELMYDGTGWVIMSEPLQAYNNWAASGITLGNGTKLGSYHRSHGWIDVYLEFVMGTTSAITGEIDVTLPIGISPLTFSAPQGRFACGMWDNGGSEYVGTTSYTGTGTTVRCRAVNTAGTFAVSQSASATVPFTWGVSDTLIVVARYPMLSRYS